MDKVFVFDHPLIQHKLTIIRDRNTGTKQFRELVDEVASLMAYEITREMSVEEVAIETPVTKATGYRLAGKKIGLVPVLRAGLGMVDGILKLIPAAKVGHVGLYRDESSYEPVEYYSKMPADIAQREMIVIDPMLATGGSASQSVKLIKQLGAKNIKFMCLIASPEGIKRLIDDHPEISIYTAAIDDHLTAEKYIYPGLGDAGDRMFGTE